MADSSSDLPLPKCIPFTHPNNLGDDSVSPNRVVGPTPGSDGLEGASACPCGWGPNLPNGPQVGTYGLYRCSYSYQTLQDWGGFGGPGIPSPEQQPTCAIRIPFGQTTMPFIGPCWTEYLTMPYCVDQANGVHTIGGHAIGPNGHAKCRSDGDFAALTQQDRIDIYNNTYTDPTGAANLNLGTHPLGYVELPVITLRQWSFINTANPSFPDTLHAPFMITVKVFANGNVSTSQCGFAWLACPQTCFGCTGQTVTNCTSNPGSCQGYDPAASLLLFNTAQTMDTCCIHGCMDNTTLSNGYPDINGNDTNGNPCQYPCPNGYFNQNYNPLATCDDGSCIPPPYGCIDIAACNYDPFAVIDDGTCCYVIGCTDPLSLNYNPNACCDDGSCCYISGCTNPIATNYNPNACYDDGSCILPTIPGCMDSYACNYNPSANISITTDCVYGGCRHPNALNYDPSMPPYDCDCNFLPSPTALNNPPYGTSSCCIFNLGCADATAYNYNVSYQGCDNGLGVPTPNDLSCCEYPTWHCNIPQGGCTPQNNQSGFITQSDCEESCVVGCTDPSALNYNANATIPCGPFNNYPTYLGCCDYPIIPGCTDPLANGYNNTVIFGPGIPLGNYNPQATVDDGSCIWDTAKFSWNCDWGSIYDPNAGENPLYGIGGGGFVTSCDFITQGGAFYPNVMSTASNSIVYSQGCWAWNTIDGLWGVVMLRPGSNALPPNGNMLLFDANNPHPDFGDLTDPNNPRLVYNTNQASTNPNYEPLFVWNGNITTYNGISNFGYWMPKISIPQPPNYGVMSIPSPVQSQQGYIPGLFVRVKPYGPAWSSVPPPQCCITQPSNNPHGPCPPFIQPAGGTLGEEPDVPIINGVARPRPDDNLTRMSYRQLGLTLKNVEKNPTISQEQALEAFREIGKEPTPVIVPNLSGSMEWWRCNHLSPPCFCEVCPYVNGQQVLDFMNFSAHYLGTDDSSCLNAANCCDPPPPPVVNSWACVKKALPPGPTGISPSGWRYECEDVGPNGPGALYESLQACQASPCEGDPNLSYSPPCTTIGMFPLPFGCTTHNNSDCGGLIDCYVYKQDCNADHNCPDITPLP